MLGIIDANARECLAIPIDSMIRLKDVIRELTSDRERLIEIGRRGREYVAKHHSIQAVGAVFDRINRSIGIEPSVEESQST